VRHKSVNTPLSHERLVGGLQDGGRGTLVTHFVQLYPKPLYTASQVGTTCRSWDEGVLTDVCLTGVLTDLCLTGLLADVCLTGVLTEVCLTGVLADLCLTLYIFVNVFGLMDCSTGKYVSLVYNQIELGNGLT